jgi:hypothetical protein
LFVDEEKVHMAQIELWKNKNIDGFYTKTTQKGGFSKQKGRMLFLKKGTLARCWIFKKRHVLGTL